MSRQQVQQVHLLFLLSFLLISPLCCHATTALPVLFLAGQSNMLGNSNQAGEEWEINHPGKGNGQMLSTLLPHLQDASVDIDQLTALIQHQGTRPQVSNTTTARHEAELLILMKDRYPSLFTDLDQPLPEVYCSFRNAKLLTDAPTEVLSFGHPALKCGNPFGLELSLAHILFRQRQLLYHDTSFAIYKFAAGGSSIGSDWRPDSGTFWNQMRKDIYEQAQQAHPACASGPAVCGWSGIVWFQGENDCFHKEQAERYYEELRYFIRKTRQELHSAAPMFESADEIPVVIVKLGAWPRYDLEFSDIVISAEERFAREDQHTFAVNSDDLSRFFHLDVASHLILGDRVARALGILMEGKENINTQESGEPKQTKPINEERIDGNVESSRYSETTNIEHQADRYSPPSPIATPAASHRQEVSSHFEITLAPTATPRQKMRPPVVTIEEAKQQQKEEKKSVCDEPQSLFLRMSCK